MKHLLIISLILSWSSGTFSATPQFNSEEERVSQFLQTAEEQLRNASETFVFINWDYATNINNQTEAKKKEIQAQYDVFRLKIGTEARQFDVNQVMDFDLKRKLKWLRDIGTSALPPEKLKRFRDNFNTMGKLYSTAKIPSFVNPQKMVSLEPDLVEIFATSRNPAELKYYWNEWRKATGGKMRNFFIDTIGLYNEAARLNGHKNAVDFKIQSYESETFVEEMEQTWKGLKPLYDQLHAYVRSKLMEKYGPDEIDPKGPIPAHLLGNMWAQTWSKLSDILRPFPNKPGIDATKSMKEKGWTPKIMFEKADQFFISLGFDPLPDEFWQGSLIEKPKDGRDLICHASAWDFYNGKDFRIKQCTRVSSEDFVTVNHEMGHTQYQRSYSNQSYLYRGSANPGFHEGVGDTISLSVGTASYFKYLGLIDDTVNIKDEETDLNIMMDMALTRVAFLPFGYLVDKYRWDLYSGVAQPDNLNCHWVKLRAEIQGVAPPNQRSEDQFDAGGKFHVASNYNYVQYFTAYIYQFQFYKSLCLISGKYVQGDKDKPLHQCDFYGSKEAGRKLREMLEVGRSRPWKETLAKMTGSHDMDTSAIREYFSPLEQWLIKYNKENNIQVGWVINNMDKMCKKKEKAVKKNSSSKSYSNIFVILVALNILYVITCKF